MQNLKKALKKLIQPRTAKAAQPAKKAPALKKKTQALPAKKAATKSPVKAAASSAKKVAAKAPAKSAAKPAAKAPAAPAKDLKKKAAAPAPKGKVTTAKAAAPAPTKKGTEKAAAPQAAAKAAKAPAAVPAPVKEPKKAKSPEAPTAEDEAKASAKARKVVEESQAPAPDEEIVLTDSEGRRYCRVKECDQIAAVDSYCRYHYLLLWKNIQNRKKILSEGKLERYIEELTARYPDKYLDMLRKDLKSEKEFLAAIQELEIDESSVDSEYEDEAQSYLEEVRGMGEGGGGAPAREDDGDF